jgi:hypothetical protein
VARTTAAKSDATTMLYVFADGDDALPIDFGGWSLEGAKWYVLKTQTKLAPSARRQSRAAGQAR